MSHSTVTWRGRAYAIRETITRSRQEIAALLCLHHDDDNDPFISLDELKLLSELRELDAWRSGDTDEVTRQQQWQALIDRFHSSELPMTERHQAAHELSRLCSEIEADLS